MTRWEPSAELASWEVSLLKLCKKQKLWEFLRRYRHLILDDEVRAWLAEAYADRSRGTQPVPAEQLLLAMLLQVGFDVPDHEVPTLTAVDRRWQMVLGLEPSDEVAFSQGTVFNFRERLRTSGVMPKILDKTVQLARETGGFGHKRLRALIDSSPLLGAGRVEDTFNLLGRAIVDLLESSAEVADRPVTEVIQEAGLLPLNESSIKAVLDVDWTEPHARSRALNLLIDQFRRLESWLSSTLESEQLQQPPLDEKLQTVERLIDQDTEPDPDPPEGVEGGAGRRIKSGGKDRIISLSDPDMRHGRKSKKNVFAGYKRHVAVDADVPGLIVAVHVDPGNCREYDAAAPLLTELVERGFDLDEVHVDRGYLPSPHLHHHRRNGVSVTTKPPARRRATKWFPKSRFEIDFEAREVTCPNGQVTSLSSSRRSPLWASYPVKTCRGCPLQRECVPNDRGRHVDFHEHEEFHREMRADLKTRGGRAKRRQRIPVEHALARVGSIQGRRARYRGLAKNQFDLERTAVVANLFTLARQLT